jgi:glycosyltransferase involved in cell wall biosynthesis
MEVHVTYYNRPQLWGKVAQGLKWNAESISRLVVVQSGPPWNLPEMPSVGTEQIARSLQKEDPKAFEVSSAMNYGMKVCRDEWVLHIDDDIVLPRGIVAKFEAALQDCPVSLLFGHARTSPTDAPIADLEKSPTKYFMPVLEKPYHIAHGAIFVVNRTKFFEMGGWNEEMTDYGYQDYEFTTRWLTKYGYSSCCIIPLIAWHLEDPGAGKPKPPADSYNLEAMVEAEKALVESLR